MNTTPSQMQHIISRLRRVKQTGSNQWKTVCPAHDDHDPSLSVSIGEDGRVLMHCHAGCAIEDIVRSIGLEMKDLYPPREDKRVNSNGKIAATYDYVDANGALVFQVVRYEDKRFVQRRPNPEKPGRWIWNLNGVERVLYNLPAIFAADSDETVFIVEGEKDVNSLSAIGMLATCNSGGAMKWNNVADDGPLHGRRIVIIADKDDPGRRHAQDVAARLHGKATSIKIIEMPDEGNKDVSDWIGSLECKEPEEICSALRQMADSASAWAPPVTTASTVSADETEATPIAPYAPFPTSVLPSPFDRYVIECAAAMCCDPAFVALPLLVVIAAAIGNARCLRLKDTWFEICILWGAIVGHSGTMKSPALDKALDFVSEYQKAAFKLHEIAMKAYKDELLRYEAALATWKRKGGIGFPPVEPEKPVAKRYFCSDTTLEALAGLLHANPRGLLLHRDELTAWFGSFDRYVQSRGGDCGQWLSVFGSRPLVIDRKKDGTLFVPRASVSIIGSIQPGILARVLGRQFYENGLAARLLLVMPPPRPKVWSESVVDSSIVQAVDEAFKNLYTLEPAMKADGEPEPLPVSMDEKAKLLWIEFYNEHNEEQVQLTGDLASMWSKIECYAARFILLIHCARCAAGDPNVSPDTVDVDSVMRGVALAKWFGAEARRVYSVLKESDVERQQTDLVETVKRHGGSITPRDLMRCSAFGTADAAKASLDVLAESGRGVWVQENADSRGRPSRRFVLTDGKQ